MTTVEGTGWRVRAACKGADPELFFPQAGEDRSREAKRYCRNCPVKRDCFEEQMGRALGRWSDFGIWGGTSPRERERIRRCRTGACQHDSHRGQK